MLIADLEVLLKNSSDDKDFVLKSKGCFVVHGWSTCNVKYFDTELQEVNDEYQNKLKYRSNNDTAMFSLWWDIDELTNLKDDIQHVRVEIGE